MAFIPDQVIREIIDANDIVSVINELLALKQWNELMVAKCPFHKDTEQSFTVNSVRQIYRCIVCQNTGNVIDFIRRFSQVSYAEALTKLAARVNRDISAYSRQKEGTEYYTFEQERLIEVNKAANDYFFFSLLEQKQRYLVNQKAMEGSAYSYLINKKYVTDLQIARFQIGYADRSLIAHMVERGFSEAELIKAGLALKTDGILEVRFNDRIVFPFFDESDNTIGFSGKSYKVNQLPKYIETVDDSIFGIRTILFNFQNTVKSISENNLLFITNNIMDVIALDRIGFKKVVATIGGTIGVRQIALIKRYEMSPILIFDNNENGTEQVIKSILSWVQVSKTIPLVNATLISIVGNKLGDIDELINFTTVKKLDSGSKVDSSSFDRIRQSINAKNINIYAYLLNKIKFDRLRNEKLNIKKKDEKVNFEDSINKLRATFFELLAATHHIDAGNYAPLLELVKLQSTTRKYKFEYEENEYVLREFKDIQSEFERYLEINPNVFVEQKVHYNRNYFESDSQASFNSDIYLDSDYTAEQIEKKANKDRATENLRNVTNKLYLSSAQFIILICEHRKLYEKMTEHRFSFKLTPLELLHSYITNFYEDHKGAQKAGLDDVRQYANMFGAKQEVQTLINRFEDYIQIFRNTDEYARLSLNLNADKGNETLISEDFENLINKIDDEVNVAKQKLNVLDIVDKDQNINEAIIALETITFDVK